MLASIYKRLSKKINNEILDLLYIRIIPKRDSYPLTGAGKRSIRDIEQMNFNNTKKLTNIIKNENIFNINKIMKNNKILVKK